MGRPYQVLFNDRGPYGVAYVVTDPCEESLTIDPGEFYLPYTGLVSDWRRLRLELREGEFVDYLASDLGCRLCSARLQSILSKNAAPSDALQWLPVDVYDDTETRPYAILHFPQPADVLSKNRTLFAGDFVVKPVFAKEKVTGHAIFAYPEAGELTLFVSEPVKRAIESAGISGLEMSPVPID